MTTQTEAVAAAAADLTHAMSKLVKAIDDVGDEAEAARSLPEDLPAELDRLLARINAAKGLAG